MIDIHTGYFDKYDANEAAEIGQLMPQLDPTFSSEPMTEEYYKEYFTDSDRSILLARLGSKIVGTAVMNTVVEQAPEALGGYMGGFVVDAEARGTSAAEALWDQMEQWCRIRGLGSFSFNTEADRGRAIKFYQKMGAKLVAGTDTHYIYEVPKPSEVTGEVRRHFGATEAEIQPIDSGRVNTTYLIKEPDQKSILQRLNPSFDARLLEDSKVVAEFLNSSGWESPVPKLLGGLSSYRDLHGDTWRQISYIEHDGVIPEVLDNDTLLSIGELLGRWHQTMSRLDYEPAFSIPHFHDTGWHAKLLQKQKSQLPSKESTRQALRILGDYEDLPPLPDDNVQLLHGDPQLTNMLFRGGKPFTYIDLDTIMAGSIWLDIGDLLRAKAEADLEDGKPVDIQALELIAEGYRRTSMPDADPHEFRKTSMLATKTIALELGMRFINDIVESSYFSWDSDAFNSRHDNHMFRAGLQQQIHGAIKNSEQS